MTPRAKPRPDRKDSCDGKHRHADKAIADAKAKADKAIADAKAKADKVIADAKAKADKAIADAKAAFQKLEAKVPQWAAAAKNGFVKGADGFASWTAEQLGMRVRLCVYVSLIPCNSINNIGVSYCYL